MIFLPIGGKVVAFIVAVGQARCVGTVNAIKAANGKAHLLMLPQAGEEGNSHMLMLDKNNIRIADLILGWIGEDVGR